MRHGFLLIDKPTGITSHDAVSQVRRALSERSIGHLGTLDPAASGLLVLAVGKRALKTVELFGSLEKEYVAEIRLGAVSSTYDREGVIEEMKPKPGWKQPDHMAVRRLIDDRFVGRITQVPPAHSALKIGGQRAYRLAREGQEVEMPAREVEIVSCQIIVFNYPNLTLKTRVSSGTYIRSLAHDLGQLLGCGGYLTALRRTMVGHWSVDQAVEPMLARWTAVEPLKDVLVGLPRMDLTDGQYQDVQHGREIPSGIQDFPAIGWHADLPVVVLEPGKREGTVHGRKVL